MHPDFRAGSIRQSGGFATVWRESELFKGLREPTTGGACNACGSYGACHGGCMAAKFFTGLPLDGPDPECVLGHGERALAGVSVAASTTADPLAAAGGLGHGGQAHGALGHGKPGRPVPVAFRSRTASRNR
jgi:radical SAM protein with 4Fe4S-binding SPASM domain